MTSDLVMTSILEKKNRILKKKTPPFWGTPQKQDKTKLYTASSTRLLYISRPLASLCDPSAPKSQPLRPRERQPTGLREVRVGLLKTFFLFLFLAVVDARKRKKTLEGWGFFLVQNGFRGAGCFLFSVLELQCVLPFWH